MARTVQLSRGKVAYVDEADYEAVSAHRWAAKPSDQADERWYAFGWVGGRNVYMHRLILGAPEGVLVDHINGDGLDNRRSNLRLCTRSQNNMNRAARLGPSGYRGVHEYKGRWRAQLEVEGLIVRTNGFVDPAFAARAYDALAREFHGAFAVLNFPGRENAA